MLNREVFSLEDNILVNSFLEYLKVLSTRINKPNWKMTVNCSLKYNSVLLTQSYCSVLASHATYMSVKYLTCRVSFVVLYILCFGSAHKV